MPSCVTCLCCMPAARGGIILGAAGCPTFAARFSRPTYAASCHLAILCSYVLRSSPADHTVTIPCRTRWAEAGKRASVRAVPSLFVWFRLFGTLCLLPSACMTTAQMLGGGQETSSVPARWRAFASCTRTHAHAGRRRATFAANVAAVRRCGCRRAVPLPCNAAVSSTPRPLPYTTPVQADSTGGLWLTRWAGFGGTDNAMLVAQRHW